MDKQHLLIFLPSGSANYALGQAYVSKLQALLAQDYEVTCLHSLDRSTLSALRDYDAIHVFTLWHRSVLHLLHKAYSLHIPVVITPLGDLQPWVYAQHQHSYEWLKWKKVITKASAVQVCGKLEEHSFQQLHLNARSVLIKNPILTSLVTFESVAQATGKLYRKVIDSNVRFSITEEIYALLCGTIQLGIDDFMLRDHEQCRKLNQQWPQLTNEQWRKILIYATDEHVDDYLSRGLERLNISKPELNVHDIDKYPLPWKYAEGDLPSDTLIPHSILVRSKLSENVDKNEVGERQLAIEMINLHHETENGHVPLRHLANVYSTLRFIPMDEDRVVDILKAMGLAAFTKKVIRKLQKTLRLPDGYAINMRH